MERSFTMPDYYPGFRCKGGSCRHNCCLGWRVTVSRQDYFRLLGLDCPPEVRRRLDISLRVLDRDATPERFAEIGHDWEGRCRLLDEHGHCLLQAGCGEEALSATCRYHPRSFRTAWEDMCAVSCSCEALVETLVDRREPLTLRRAPLDPALGLPPATLTGGAADHARTLRDAMLDALRDRRLSLDDRMDTLARLCAGADGISPPPLPCPDIPALAQALLGGCDSTADLVRACLDKARRVPFAVAATCLAALIPQPDVFLEHLLVNHCLFQGMPETPGGAMNDCLELYALLLTVRWILAYAAVDAPDRTSVIDACTDCFRIYEHGNFGPRAAARLREMGR